MLSYLKEEKNVPASSKMEADGDSTTTAQDYMTVSGSGQKLKQTTLALAVLFGIGVLGIWLMVKKTTPASADAQTAQDSSQLDQALAQLKTMQSEMDTQMNSVAGRFYHFTNVEQVAVDELKKNPFQLELNYASADNSSSSQKREQVQQEAQVLAMGLELWSITSTPKGMCCMIDDKVLYEGDTYRGMTVTKISGKSATLTYKGVDMELKLD